MKKEKKLFVCSIDGPDFCGKTTIANLVVEELRRRFPGRLIKRTHLPSDLVTGAFTKILRNSADQVSDEVFALAYAADHLHHDRAFVEKLRKHANDAILVQERSLLTTLVYHGIIGKVDVKWVREINRYDKNIPDMQIILKVGIDELLKRKRVEQRDFDRFETEAHLKRQTDAYYNLPPGLQKEFSVNLLEANGSPEEVAAECAGLIRQKLTKD